MRGPVLIATVSGMITTTTSVRAFSNADPTNCFTRRLATGSAGSVAVRRADLAARKMDDGLMAAVAGPVVGGVPDKAPAELPHGARFESTPYSEAGSHATHPRAAAGPRRDAFPRCATAEELQPLTPRACPARPTSSRALLMRAQQTEAHPSSRSSKL